MCECGGSCMCGHVGEFSGGSRAGARLNIASCCCVCDNTAWISLVSTLNADTLSWVACAEVLLSSWTCCSCAIKPLFMDAQLSSSDFSVLFVPWYPIVPAVPAPERTRRSHALVKCALN